MNKCCCKAFRNPNLCLQNIRTTPCCLPIMSMVNTNVFKKKQTKNKNNDTTINFNRVYYPYSYRQDSSSTMVNKYQMFVKLKSNNNQIKSILNTYDIECNSVISTLNNNLGLGLMYHALFTILIFEYNKTENKFVSLSSMWFRYYMVVKQKDATTKRESDNKIDLNKAANNILGLVNTNNNDYYSLFIPVIEGTKDFNFYYKFENCENYNITLNYYENYDEKVIFTNSIKDEVTEYMTILNLNTQNGIINLYNYITLLVKGTINGSPYDTEIGISVDSSGDVLIDISTNDGASILIPYYDNYIKNNLINNSFKPLYYYSLTGSSLSEIDTTPTQIQFKQIKFYKTNDSDKQYNYIINDNLDLSTTEYIKNALK